VQAAQLPGRQDERTAQRAAAQAAQEVLKQSQWRTRQKQQSAMQAALVAEVYYRVGEYVQPGQPVLSLLPPANIKARFFVPEQSGCRTRRSGCHDFLRWLRHASFLPRSAASPPSPSSRRR
jgi:multidrug efflux pump subunit AcrA (membrane-fusion protein)